MQIIFNEIHCYDGQPGDGRGKCFGTFCIKEIRGTGDSEITSNTSVIGIIIKELYWQASKLHHVRFS